MRSYRPPIEVKSCKYCTDYKGQPKPIMPEDLYRVKLMPDGSLKCHKCQEEDIQKMIRESKKRRGVI